MGCLGQLRRRCRARQVRDVETDVPDLESLTKRAASSLIDTLKAAPRQPGMGSARPTAAARQANIFEQVALERDLDHAGLGREVVHDAHAFQGFPDDVRITDVTTDQLNLVREVVWPAGVLTVHLLVTSLAHGPPFGENVFRLFEFC